MYNKNKSIFIIICLLITIIYVPIHITYANPVTQNNEMVNNASISNDVIENNVIENNLVENKVTENINQNNLVNENKLNFSEEINKTFNEAEPTNEPENISNVEATLSAKIFDTTDYTNGTELTTEGISIQEWQYSTSKYLQIDPIVPNDDNDYIISVELPKEFYFVCDEISLPTGYSKYEFTKNEGIIADQTTLYNSKPFSGKIDYYMSSTALSGTIQLEIRYDNVLWNKAANSLLTSPDVNPIAVKLTKVDSADVTTEIKELKVSQVYSKSKFSYSSLLYYKTSADVTESLNELSTMSIDKTLYIGGNFYYSSDVETDFYFNNATIEIQLPYYTDLNNNKYYLELLDENIGFPTVRNLNYTITRPEAGKICIDFLNYYCKPGRFIALNFSKFPQELESYELENFVFSNGNIKFTTKSKDNTNDINVCNLSISNITYQKTGKENVQLSSSACAINVGSRPDDAISLLGLFRLKNAGSKDSGEKEVFIEFDINNTNVVQITSMRIGTDKINPNIEIEYTMVDEAGNLVYFDENGNPVDSSTSNAQTTWKYIITNNTSNKPMISRTNLKENHQNFYFKSFKYKIKTILAGQSLFIVGSDKGMDSAGTIWGYANGCSVKNNNIYHRMTVTSLDDTTINPITKTAQTLPTTTLNSGYYFSNVAVDKDKIEAGEYFNLSGKVQLTAYPYGNSNWLKAPIIGLVLPNGISVNSSNITAKTSKGFDISNITVSNKPIDETNSLWIIKFPSDFYIGYYTELFSSLSKGASMDFNIQLDTTPTMNNTSFFATNMYLAAAQQTNAVFGSYNWALKDDIYDLNENGSTTDKISGLKNSNTTNCQIVAQSATLDLNSSINLNSSGNIGQESSSISTLTKDDIITYNLDIACNKNGRAEEFIGFIPIPKLNSGRDEYLITSPVAASFELNLQDFATITGSDKYNFEYSFEPNLTYATAKESTEWYTKEQIESNSDLNIQDVTMIKLTAKNGTIENGDNTRISINMKYNGEDYISEVGSKNTWSSVLYYTYINSDRTVSGIFNVPEVEAKITHTEELNEVTLTAAKDMQPKKEGNINELDVNFRSLKNIHNLSITNVEVYNVSLKTKEYILENLNMPGIESNKNFAITIQMPDNTEKNITEAVLTNPVSIGTIASNEELNYKLKLYNANSLTDNSLARYIIITLKSDNGITFKQKININRELSQATSPKTAIVAGKRYINFDDIATEIKISQDSALTSQFVIDYIPTMYNNQKLQFSNELPINTQITLVNLTESSNVQYYYYKVDNKINELNLNEFILMGKTNTNYEYPTIDNFINEKLLVIIDFSKCSEYIENETIMKLVMSGEQVDDFNSKELKFISSVKRTFELLTNSINVNIGENVQINYNLSTINSYESNYLGKKLALVIKMPNNIPIDAYIISNDTKYNLNSNKEFIIPLTEVQNGSGQIEFKLNSNIDSKEEMIYECNLELWASATSNALAPMFGEKLAETTINFLQPGKLNPSLKILELENRAIRKSDIENVNQLFFEIKNSEDTIVELELQQKSGSTYQKLTTILNQVNDSTEPNMGVFTIDAIEGNNTVNISLSPAIESGTYRFVIKVKDKMNNKLLEVPYNFVVLEE